MLQKRRSVVTTACMVLSLVIATVCLVNGQVVKAAATKEKTLIVYFTRGDNVKSKHQLDSTSSASINLSGSSRVGNAELVAKKIRQKTGGDLFSIKVKNKYTNSYDELVDIGEKEMEQNARPALAKRVKNMKKYDRIILCYPVWWDTMPMPVHTFLESYNFSGKTIYACATHEGSGYGSSIQDIKKLCKGAKIKKGFSIYGSEVKKPDKKVKELVKKIKA